MTNLLQIIVLLQMALSLLTASQNTSNELLKKTAIDFSNQAISLAIKAISEVPTLPQAVVSNPVQVGNQVRVETPAPVVEIATSTIPIKPEIEFTGNGRIRNSTPDTLYIEAIKITLMWNESQSEAIMNRADGVLLHHAYTSPHIGDVELWIGLKEFEIPAGTETDTIKKISGLDFKATKFYYHFLGGGREEVTMPEGGTGRLMIYDQRE